MPRLRITVLDHPATLAGHMAAWNDLAAAALEPNVFYEPWMMLPAIDSFARGEAIRYVLLYADQADAAPLLCGLFPLERVASYNAACRFATSGCGSTSTAFSARPWCARPMRAHALPRFSTGSKPMRRARAPDQVGRLGADGPFFRALPRRSPKAGGAASCRTASSAR